MGMCALWATAGVAIGLFLLARPSPPTQNAATAPRTGNADPSDDLTLVPVLSEPYPGPQAVPGNVDILTAHEGDLDPGQNDAGKDDLRSPARAPLAESVVGVDPVLVGEAPPAAEPWVHI